MSIPPAATDDIAATFGRAPIQAHRTLCQNLLVSLCSVFAVVQDVDRRSRRGRCGSFRERAHPNPGLLVCCAKGLIDITQLRPHSNSSPRHVPDRSSPTALQFLQFLPRPVLSFPFIDVALCVVIVTRSIIQTKTKAKMN